MKSKDSTMVPACAGISTQVAIPHTGEPDITLVGILQRIESGEPTFGRNIALVRISNPMLSIVPFVTIYDRFYTER